GVPVPHPLAVAVVHPLRAHLAVRRAAADLDLGVHHLLGERPDHLPQHVRARRRQGLLELRAGNRHNVTRGHFALLRLRLRISKDREVAASRHGNTPYSGKLVTLVPVTPYTTSVDANRGGTRAPFRGEAVARFADRRKPARRCRGWAVPL